MSSENRWIAQKAASSLDPVQVESCLANIDKSWPADAAPLREVIENFPLGESALLHLISVSSICANRLAVDPNWLLWLANPEICASERDRVRMLASLRRFSDDPISENNFRSLRLWKSREMLRIALREVAEIAAFEETTAELSQLAEICLTEVYEHWNADLRSRLGSPNAAFTILALGKLGGHELNHSSDVDLIFLYSDEGQLAPNLTYHQWFNRLSSSIAETFTIPDAGGPLFRLDFRLRPEGAAGPLARSLESMENYYAGFGETWERLALIKARGVCGSRELAYEFLSHHQSFIYPKSSTPDLFEEIAAIKRRIDRDIVGHENLDRNVKLGVGGIREIEFVTQTLQLVHGARHAFLQETSTLKALRALAQLDLLKSGDNKALRQAYRFLRRVEHRLQIESEQQTHTVPSDAGELRRLARSLDFPSADSFLSTLHEHMQSVRSIFEKIFSGRVKSAEVFEVDPGIFKDAKAAAKTLGELEKGASGFHIAPRTRQVFRRLQPLLLQALSKVADPDATLNRFVRFVEAYGLRSLLFELLAAHPALVHLLARTFDASRPATDLLIRRPQLLEELTRGGMLDRKLSVTDHISRLDTLGLTASDFDAVRAYRQRQLLRLLLRDLLRLTDLPSLFSEYSALAEAILLFMNRALGNEQELTIVAMGKFGGAELTYGADLDVLFVGEDNRAAQQLMVAMAQPSAEGSIALLDARLRPDGEKGPLVCSLESYETYYEKRAQFWELQALTRARPIGGPLQFEYVDLAQRVWRKAAQNGDPFHHVREMLTRIQRDRSSGSDFLDFKTGVGGMIEAEFLVQALQMREMIWNPNTLAAIDTLQDRHCLAQDEAASLKRDYLFLRECESVLARVENKSVSSLPASETDQEILARRLGSGSRASFIDNYRLARERIHALCQHHFA
ncbi:MAG: [glutamine synthetase] adenylyltransferase / [glutamine synthetase]-adenylyl-L-tyrosine [Verrucomicrobiota bacterium]|jgi:glutamate-ammonia-ligase adenylyltransferase